MTIGKQFLGLILAISIAWPFCVCAHAESAEETPASHSCCSAKAPESPQDQPEPNDGKPCSHCDAEPADMAKMIQLAPPAESGLIAPPPFVVELAVQYLLAPVELRESAHDPPPRTQQLLGAWLCVFRL